MTPRRSVVAIGLESIRDRLSTLGPSPDGDEPVLYECRHCGTTFDAEPENCSGCGGATIAAYRPSTLR